MNNNVFWHIIIKNGNTPNDGEETFVPHFFIKSKDIKNSNISISDKENYSHIAKSLRAKSGEKILLIDENQTQHEGIINVITNKEITIDIKKSYPSKRKLEFRLFLAQTPLRSDSQNVIIEKATELGLDGIYPTFTDNCALKKSIIEQKIPKWQKIMAEASKQCERAYIPTCFELTKLQNLISDKTFDRILAFTERSAKFPLKKYLRDNKIKKDEKILVIIGPEGGFSNQEFEFFEHNNIVTLSLGELILKAETAVITAIGNIIYEYE